MVRETRHLWVGNLPENIREDRIREHFKRYGRVQNVKLLSGTGGGLCAAVAFMDIKSAAKAHNCEHTLDEHALSTEYYEPGPYTAPQQRFPIGSGEEHSTFERASHFYERGTSTPVTPIAAQGARPEADGYLRRSSVYHTPSEPIRGRPRERLYRNGPPYGTATERSSGSNHRRTWSYDSGSIRYLNSSDDHGITIVKTKKVRSGSESRSGSQSSRSRSPTRSTTGSPRSSDSSTRSESPRSTRVSVQSAVAPPVQQTQSSTTLAVYSEDRRPLAICVRNLPTRSSDTSLKDGLFHEYKKHGKVTWVKVVGAANERYALVCFKKPEDVEKAIEVSQDKLFFGCKIDVAPYHGYDVEDNEARPYDTELDEYHPKATRTLFIGNLEKDVTATDIRQTFEKFGEIIEIDIKKQSGVALSYAFCQYADIASVVQAIRTLDGEPLGGSRLKLGFGKSMASSCVWIAGVAEQMSDKLLDIQFRKFGPVSGLVVDRERGQALIFYEQVPAAAAAVKEMRGMKLRGQKIQIDFASRECQEAFYERVDVQARDRDGAWSSFETSRSDRDLVSSRYESGRFRYDAQRVRSSSYSRSSGGRTPRRHDAYDSPRYKSYEDLSPSSDYEDFAPNEAPDLRHLHKERNHLQHLLDQLDRPLRSVTAADQGLVVTAHNHKRRLSSHRRSSGEGPAPICKRRKTGSTSEDEKKRHHHHHSGDESRPGTPLFDEKPDNIQPQEPRRVPRERPEEPLSLPLPQFAAHCFSNVKTSVSSTSAATSTTTSTTETSSHQAPPASPVRPPSPSSTSSSEISPQSPTLEERIRSLDEKYEKWTGRTLQPPTKPKHRLLDVDVRELQPSDIVKSVLAKPSVFDEDSKRLENFGEKYEPRDFSSYPRTVGLDVQRFVPGDPRNPSYIPNLSVKVSPLNSPSGAVLSPCPAAKGLQYPFPSHPPVQPTTSVATTTAGSPSPPTPAVRPISRSMEFSVQKAESWLGITKTVDGSSLKDTFSSCGGAYSRFNVHSKPSEQPVHRHSLLKSADSVVQKVDSVQKPSDPRLEKCSIAAAAAAAAAAATTSVTTTTSVLTQRIAVKSTDSEINKSDINSQSFKFASAKSSDSLRVKDEVTNVLKSSNRVNWKAEEGSGKLTDSKNQKEGLWIQSSEKIENYLQHAGSGDYNNSVGSSTVKKSDSNSLQISDNKVDIDVPSALSSESGETEKTRKIKDLDNLLQTHESTKKLESSLLLKSNHSQMKTESVIVESDQVHPASSARGEAPKSGSASRLAGARAWEKMDSKSKISESNVKIVSENDKIQSSGHTSAAKDEFIPYNVRDKESGSDKVKIVTKDRDRCVSSNREEKTGNIREAERDKNKDKFTIEKDREREKDKGVSRDKQKEKEMFDSTDKERRKDREFESERKRDREAAEVLEREKRKEEDAEKDRRKDHLDTLDRRKDSGDRKAPDHDKSKKKEEEKERRKDKDGADKDKRKEQHVEKHRKSNDEKKKDTDGDVDKMKDGKKKERNSSQPAVIGSKRRISSQDGTEGSEESKRLKLDHKRRDSKDSKSNSNNIFSSKSSKNEHRSQESKSSESKHKSSSEAAPESKSSEAKSQEYKRKEDSERKRHQSESLEKKRENMKKIQMKLEDVLKPSNDANGKSSKDASEKAKDPNGASDVFDDKKHSLSKRESKDRKKMLRKEFGSTESLEEKKLSKKDKKNSIEKKREEEGSEEKRPKEKTKMESRKENGHYSPSDSDSEPKRHSIFDIVLDEPAYISMYDKVKARSCKNMQKQEEEKRQGKLKEKFTQLKQSRAKREEKKRSTSWDEDSDSDASQIRRIPRRPFSRLSSEDEGVVRREKKTSESWDNDTRSTKKMYDTSEDEGGMKPKTGRLHASDIYSDESDNGFTDNASEKPSKKFTPKSKVLAKTMFESSEEESPKKQVSVSNTSKTSSQKPEKINSECKNKVRLSLDSSTERFSQEVKTKKRTVTESMSEGEPTYHSSNKSPEKIDRKKSKKKEKRQKSLDEESKHFENSSNEKADFDAKSERKKQEKRERRKSIQSALEEAEDVAKQKKKKSPKRNMGFESVQKHEDGKISEMFDDFSDDSSISHPKFEVKSNPSKWQVSQIYGTDSDSNFDPVDSAPTPGKDQLRKGKEKKKKDKKSWETSEELLQAGRALEQMLASPPSRRNSDETVKRTEVNEESGAEKKPVKEKKKKRKKSKEEKSSRHHHHHHHHYFKSESVGAPVPAPPPPPQSPPAQVPEEIDSPVMAVKRDPTPPRSPSPPSSISASLNGKKSNKLIPGFNCEIDEKLHETAVQSIALIDLPKIEPKNEAKEEAKRMVDAIAKREENKERTVISQEETEDAVAALLGETFTYSSCFEGNSPVEPEPESHDEEEMRQAVRSLNEGKPDTPQSESDLQIDTDAEETEEHFSNSLRFDSLPRTPDLDLSQPPKTPDIQPSFFETKPSTFPRRDTVRNSREEMEVPIVEPASPQEHIEYAPPEDTEKPKECDLKPPILKPASPKLYRNEALPLEPPMPAIKSPERIYVDNRLLLAPPPLVPVTKQVSSPSPPRSSPNISLVRPILSLSSNSSAPALVLTSIRTTAPIAPIAPITVSTGSSTLPKKAYAPPPSIIATSHSSGTPQVLSPITPCSPTTPKTTSSAFTQAVATLTSVPKFSTATTIVSPRHLSAHLMPQKIIVHQVPKLATPPPPPPPPLPQQAQQQPQPQQQQQPPQQTTQQTRILPTSTSVVQVVEPTLSVKKSSSNDMPALTVAEPVSSRPTATIFTTPPPALGPALSQAPPVTSTFDVSRSSLIQTSSIISVVSRSPVSSATRFATTSIITQASSNLNLIQTSSTSSVRPLTTPVISVHPNLPTLVQSKPASTTCQAQHQSVVTSQKTAPFANFQTSVISSTGFSQVAEVPKVSVITPEPASINPASPKAEQTKTEPETDDEDKNIEFQKLVAELEHKERSKEMTEPIEKKEVPEVKNEVIDNLPAKGSAPSVLVEVGKEEIPEPACAEVINPVFEQTESVIKKVDSLISLKSEESMDENLAVSGDKSDTSSVNQDDVPKSLSSEEDNKQTSSVIARKGRKKTGRGAGACRRTRNSGGKAEASAARKTVRATRGGRSVSDPGKKSTDIYEFHDESDEDGDPERDRPRLILTIKSPNGAKDPPVVTPKPCSTIVKSPNSMAPAKSPGSVKSPKEGTVISVRSPEHKSPAAEKDCNTLNTRKSRRLQEKDVSRNTVDDVIEDVIRNGGPKNGSSPRRSSRQVVKIATSQPPITKKAGTRGTKKLTRCPSTDDELKEPEVATSKTMEISNVADLKEMKLETSGKDAEEQEAEEETSDDEPTTLIDPVTGMLMVMRAKEEGKYVPVPNAQPVAPPTPPPPSSKPDNLPIVNEGLASHWLTQETLKQAVMKAQHYGEPNKINQVFMNRPPTPPATPQAKLPEALTRLPVDVIKKIPSEQIMEAECTKQEKDGGKAVIHPIELAKHKMSHLEPGKYPSEMNRMDYQDMNRSLSGSPEPVKMIRQLPKAPMPTNLVKAHCPKSVGVVLATNKPPIYQNAKKLSQSGILTAAVASSPPRVVKASPPAHELHPMTGAVASPPPRAPHLASQQPVVTGASSSRALVDAPKGSAASSPRGLTIPQFDSPMHTSGQGLYSPPPAHQQGETVNMGHLGHSQFVHSQLVYQQYLRAQEMLPSPYQLTSSLQGKLEERERERGAGDMCRSPPLELRNQRATDSPTVYMGRQHYTRYYDDPPPAHLHVSRHVHQVPDPPGQPRLQVATPPHASQVPPQADSLLLLLQRYPIMWQGLLALKNDQSAVQMHFVFGNPMVARDSLPCNSDGSTPPLRIAQRMRLEQTQLEGVARKMQMDHEHCMLLALPCGRDHMDVLQQSTNLQTGFITYLQQKQAAGIVNIAHPGSQQPAFVVHIFPSCEFANESLARNAPDLLHRMQEIPHLVIVIATV